MVFRIRTTAGEIITEEKVEYDPVSMARGGEDVDVKDVSITGQIDMSMMIDDERFKASGIEVNFNWSLKDQDYLFEMVVDEEKVDKEEPVEE